MSEQVRRFMAPTNDTCDMDSYQQVVLAADHDAAVQALRADAREWKAKAEEALNDWRKACQLNGEAAGREFKLKAEAEALRVALAGMLFAFDDGVGQEWSKPLLDYARTLTPAKEYKP